MLATTMGMMLAAAALWLFAQQGQLMRSLFNQQAQAQDFFAMTQVLRSELRVAGQRHQPGASPPHDELLLDEGKAPLLQYLCDRCGSPDRTHASGFRLQEGIMGHRSLGATAHQALNDPRTAAVWGWRISQGQTPDCSPWITLRLEGDPIFAAARFEWIVTIKPRNLGPLNCESADSSARSSSAQASPSMRPSRTTGAL